MTPALRALAVAGALVAACASVPPPAPAGVQVRAPAAATPLYGARVVRTYPHDRFAYTQGLVYRDGVLYEGTGIAGRSSIRKVELATGKVLKIRALDAKYFGEGIALWKDRLVQLTWQSGVGFVYDRETFEPVRTFTYAGEGWGLTDDGKRLIMSDGSSVLRFLDPDTLREIGRLPVRDEMGPVDKLNELEFVDGAILANIFETDTIARIDPKTGRVAGWIDLRGLLSQAEQARVDAQEPGGVLNGIAYDAAGRRLFVTGKLWPKIFEIQLVPR